jgi:hypothetical protein
MDGRKTVSIYHLIIIAIVLLMAFAFVVHLNRVHVSPNSAVKPPARKTTAPAVEIELSPSIPTVNPFPGDEEIKKNIEEQAERQEGLKEKIANRDKKAAIVRAEVTVIQDELLSDEIKNARQMTTASSKTISTVTYAKKGLSNETKQTILSGGRHVGH